MGEHTERIRVVEEGVRDVVRQNKRLILLFTTIAFAVGGGAGTLGAGAQVDKELNELDKRVDRIESNQRIIDYQMRQAMRDATWNGQKLDAIAGKVGAESPPKPPLPKSELATP